MFYTPILLGSVRDGRMSPRVARFVHETLAATGRFEPEILDLLELELPVMSERLRMQKDPPAAVVEFGKKIARADALVIVSPEYNAGYPGVLKNAIDYLLPEYKRKPVGIVTVSGGQFGGILALGQLRQVMTATGAYVLPVGFPVTKVGESFAEDGTPLDLAIARRAANFVGELLWLTEAVDARKRRDAEGA